jgi:hypothetical protein
VTPAPVVQVDSLRGHQHGVELVEGRVAHEAHVHGLDAGRRVHGDEPAAHVGQAVPDHPRGHGEEPFGFGQRQQAVEGILRHM